MKRYATVRPADNVEGYYTLRIGTDAGLSVDLHGTPDDLESLLRDALDELRLPRARARFESPHE